MDKKAVIRSFSRYAHTYDKYADVQRHIASELLGPARKKKARKILEIGSGTGNYTLLLKENFYDAEIKAVDICGKMAEVAFGKIKSDRVKFIVEDAEKLDVQEKFDLVTSNACIQWFEDLEAALKKYKDLLEEGGLILFSAFGPRTFFELNDSLSHISKDLSVGAVNFATKEKITNLLMGNFKDAQVREIEYEESFLSLRELLDKIKYTGTNGFGPGKKVFFTPRILNKLEQAYLTNFGRIRATYQVFFCSGVK